MLKNIEKISSLDVATLSFIERLANDKNIKKIIVFGSRARDDFETYSDLDLAVEHEDFDKEKWLSYKEFLTYEIKTNIKISLVDFNSNPARLKQSILSKGIIIYDKYSKTK